MSSRASFPHLVARFFGVLTARPLRPIEQQQVAGWLDNEVEGALFWDQSSADQRHGYIAAAAVAARLPERRDVIRAALLHDVGKRHARLGVIARSFASLVGLFGGSGRGRVAAYLDHGRRAAPELADAGAEAVVVDYARHHHATRPSTIDQATWDLLQAADRASR